MNPTQCVFSPLLVINKLQDFIRNSSLL